MLLLLREAQNGSEVIEAAGAWGGAGLVGLILGWLCLKYLPSQDARQERLILENNKLVVSLVAKFDEALRAEQEGSERARAEARSDYLRSVETISGSLTRAVEVLGEINKALKD